LGDIHKSLKEFLKKESVPENVALNAEIKTVRHKAKKLRKPTTESAALWRRTFEVDVSADGRGSMALVRVKPTKADVAIADAIAARTDRPTEHAAEALTWGADEHVLCALAFGWWLYAIPGDTQTRRASDHVLLTTLVASALPHVLKRVFDQERPDRLTARGHLHGIPLSGRRLDAFPSGHAVHIGALASAATVLPPAQRNTVWAIGGCLVVTRIVLLAHWTSDVVAGLALGAVIERLLRSLTGFGRR
jgi:undecaprenyl-diphosphatase